MSSLLERTRGTGFQVSASLPGSWWRDWNHEHTHNAELGGIGAPLLVFAAAAFGGPLD